MTVTAASIRAMVPDIPDELDVDWAISDANALMEAPFLNSDPKPAQTLQDLVIRYLAAHFLVLNVERGGLSHVTIGGASEGYKGDRSTSGLSLTRYGQQAIALDPTRTLAGMDTVKMGTAQFTVV
jgi:hypothetical protein